MERQHLRKKPKISRTTHEFEEVCSIEWEFIHMTEQEEDLIYRMHRLVGERWDLIAGRIPGRNAEEIERFWIMRNSDGFGERRREHSRKKKSKNMRSFFFSSKGFK